jgi:hypothetical protein
MGFAGENTIAVNLRFEHSFSQPVISTGAFWNAAIAECKNAEWRTFLTEGKSLHTVNLQRLEISPLRIQVAGSDGDFAAPAHIETLAASVEMTTCIAWSIKHPNPDLRQV